MRSLTLGVLLVCLYVAVSQAQVTEKRNLLQEDVGYVNAATYAPKTHTGLTLANAIAGIAGANRTLFVRVGAPWVISSNFTVPANIVLWIPDGATIQVNAGVTLTLARAPRYHRPNWLSGAGTLSVTDPMWPVDVRIYGVVGDGVADDWRALQMAINASGASIGVACTTLPPGTFKVSGTLTIPWGGCYRGSGHGPYGATKIVTTSPNADILYVSGQNVTISDLQLDSSVTRNGGAHIHLDSAGGASQNIVVERVEILKAHVGIYHHRASLITVRDNTITVPGADGVGVLIQNTDNSCDANTGLYQNNNLVGPSGSTITASRAFWHQAGGGLMLTHNQTFGFGYNVYMQPHPTCTAVSLSEFTIAHNHFDGYTVSSIYLLASLPTGLTAVRILGNNISPVNPPANTEAIVMAGAISGVTVVGNQVGGAAGSLGIHVFSSGAASPSLIHIGGNAFFGNSSNIAINISAGGTLISDNLIYGFTRTHVVAGGIALTDVGSSFTFAQLGEAGGLKSRVWCTDCGVTDYVVPVCIGGGPGTYALRLATAWTCG